jgi:hypothetical protein
LPPPLPKALPPRLLFLFTASNNFFSVASDAAFSASILPILIFGMLSFQHQLMVA